MTAQLLDSNGSAVSGTVNFGITITYHYITQPSPYCPNSDTDFTNTIQSSSFGQPPGPPTPVQASSPWDLGQAWSYTGLRGGNATINWSYQPTPTSATQTGSFAFVILGVNPPVSSLRNQLASLSAPWFMEHITWHENHARQFCPLARVGSDSSPYCNWNFPPGQSPSSINGTPIFGCPQGYGLFQLDPPYSLDNLWSWRSNVAGGVQRVKAVNGPALWNQNINAMDAWNRQPVNAGAQIAPPDGRAEGPYCNFSFSRTAPDTSTCVGSSSCNTWFADAIVMKRNGGIALLGVDYFMKNDGSMARQWDYIGIDSSQPPLPADPIQPVWHYIPRNTVDSNIVRAFCNSVIPGNIP